MNENLEIKDRLYYEDLIYAIKKIGNLEYTEDKTLEERIALRLQPIYSEEKQKENELMGEELSDFELDIFLIIRNIGKKANDSFKSLGNIRKYPELIKEEIIELEKNLFGEQASLNQNGTKKEKPFDPNLWKPIGYKPVDVKPVYSQKHTGFVEYQAPEDRYEVRGVMPPAKNWYQQDLDEITRKLTKNKK